MIFYTKNKSNLKIKFNRVAFIFFTFFMISNNLFNTFNSPRLKKSKTHFDKNNIKSKNNLYRADIIDRDGNYLSKNSKLNRYRNKPIKNYRRKLILNLKYIFPNKNYIDVKKIK